jgi:hypothetical protein
MLEHYCPLAGIKVGEHTIFDMLYADDSTLAATSPQHLQHQLDIVKLFCDVFGMKVNVKKTEIMVFRTKGMVVPLATWNYNGNTIRVVESTVYLGYPLHAMGVHRPWEGQLKVAGLKASHALRGRIIKHDIYSPELRLRLFDTVVKPVVCYGCQIWGADWALHNSPKSALDNPLQRIHLNFLRFVSGAATHVPNEVMLQEFKAAPMVCHWLRLVLRFWNELVKNTHWLMHSIFKTNVAMAVAGLKSCWAAKLICTLRKLDELPGVYSADTICKLQFDVDRVVDKMQCHIFQALVNTHANPRTCPNVGVKHCAYTRWFAQDNTTLFHPLIKCINIPTGKHKELMRFRLGCAEIAVNEGRFDKGPNKRPRADRVCPCCTSGQAEDELHVVFECSAYSHIRGYPRFAALLASIPDGNMRELFSDPNRQDILADFIRALSLARKRRLATILGVA